MWTVSERIGRPSPCSWSLPRSAVSGCGGDDDSTSRATGAPASSDNTEGDGAAEGTAWPEPPFTVDLRAADVFGELEPFEDEGFEVSDTIAVKVADSAYTTYLADYALDREDFGGFETPHPPAGKTLVTVSITVFDAEGTPPALEVGQEVPAGAEFGEQTFVVIVERGADMYSSSPRPEGSLTIREVGDERICFDVDHRDHEEDTTLNGEEQFSPVQKRLVGTVSAEVVEFGP